MPVSLQSQTTTERPPTVRERAPGSPVWWSLLAVIGSLLVWTRLTGIGRSLWWDEAFTANRYVRLGMEAILDPELYFANNHVLYSIVAHYSARWLGPSEAVLRLGSLVPALVSVALLVWLLWRRMGPPVAVLALALITTSSLAASLHTEARGYGLVLLTVTVLLAVPVVQHRRPTWGGDLLFAAAGVAATLTFAPAVTVYLAHAGLWLVLRSVHRLRLVVLTAAAGALTLLVLHGLLPMMLSRADQVGSRHAEPLRWWSPLSAAFHQQVGAGLQGALPGPGWLWASVAIAAGLLGLVVLLSRDRVLGWHVLVAVAAPVAVLAVMRFHPVDRYLAFLMPQAMTAAAVGLAAACGAVGVRVGRRSVVAVTVVCAVLLLFGVPAVERATTVPRQNFASVAQAVEDSDPAVIAIRNLHAGYAWYLDDLEITMVDSAEALETAFCEGPRPAAYVPDPDREPEGPPPSCLDQARWIAFEMQRDPGEMGFYLLDD